jgi:hypothetical protein
LPLLLINRSAKSSHEKSACKEEFIQQVFPIFRNPRKRDVSAPPGLILAMAFARGFAGAAAEGVEAGGLAAPHTPHLIAPSGFTRVHTGQVQGILLIYTE